MGMLQLCMSTQALKVYTAQWVLVPYLFYMQV